MDTTFFTGIIASLILVTGAAWPDVKIASGKKPPHPIKSVKNWFLAMGSLGMLIYGLLGYMQGGVFFFVILQIFLVLTSILMMLNVPERIKLPAVATAGIVLVAWSLFLFEDYNTLFFIGGLALAGIGYILKGGTVRRSVALMLGNGLIATYSWIEASWVFFAANAFFTCFCAYWVYMGLRAAPPEQKERNSFIIRVIILYPVAIASLGAMLFIPAGTTDFWQAWVFMPSVFLPSVLVTAYFLNRDPAFLRRRMKYKEKETMQDRVIKISGALFFASLITCGLDFRYGWSQVPYAMVIAGNAVVALSFLMIFFVFRENSYAGRTVRVERGQKVISTGPYAVVRHPMYTFSILMYLFVPIALGSFWSLLLIVPAVIPIFFRIFNEEEVLMRELEGYKAYMKKVRYRLIPNIW